MLHIKRFKQSYCPFTRLGIWHSRQHGQKGYVVGDIEERNQIRCLEYKAYPVPPQGTKIFDLPAVIINDVISEYHFSGGRLDHRSQTFKERGFARSRRTYQSNDLARRNVHVDGL